MSKTVEIIDEDKFISDIVNLACAAHSIIDLDISDDHAETALIFLAAGVINANIEEIVYEDTEDAESKAPEEPQKPENILGYTVRHTPNNVLPIATVFGNRTDAQNYIEEDVFVNPENYQVVTITGEGPEAPSVKAEPATSAGFVIWSTEKDEVFEHRRIAYSAYETALDEIDYISTVASDDNDYLGYSVGDGAFVVKEIFV